MNHKVLGLIGAALAITSCGEDNPIKGITDELAMQCGIDINCEGPGIAEGNAAISGVGKVDAFFQSVINFQTRAEMVASGIDAEVQAIGAAFGIEGDVGAGLEAKIDAMLEGGLTVEAEPAKCEVDARASVEVAAKCEGMAMPPKVEVECNGSCEVEASADVSCEGSAELSCTVTAPSVRCMGECKGTCTLEGSAAADCSGTCRGTCDGECSLRNAQGQCEGKCDGECQGSCDVQLEASATCMGSCKGECTTTGPDAECEGAVRASCNAKGNASVMCEGRCDGEVTPPSASVECEATAKAEANMSVECSPPRIAVKYEFAAGVSAEARAEFEAGLRVLEARLPALLASVRKANFVLNAGEDIAADASGAIEAAVGNIGANGNLRVQFGLICAARELGKVGAALESSTDRLSASFDAALELTAAVGLPNPS